jgi:hypothetical protein
MPKAYTSPARMAAGQRGQTMRGPGWDTCCHDAVQLHCTSSTQDTRQWGHQARAGAEDWRICSCYHPPPPITPCTPSPPPLPLGCTVPPNNLHKHPSQPCTCGGEAPRDEPLRGHVADGAHGLRGAVGACDVPGQAKVAHLQAKQQQQQPGISRQLSRGSYAPVTWAMDTRPLQRVGHSASVAPQNS